MDIRVLHYFVTIVQTKSISNAAQSLHVTQPTLSRQIRDLEEELETILFYRGSREIQLTEDGRYLYNRAIEILALVSKTENSIRRTDSISGDLYIGAAETQSFEILARAVQELTTTYPETRVHLRSGNADFVQEYLDQGLFDLGVTFGPFDDRKYSHLNIPNQDSWGVLVPKNHPLTAVENPSLQDAIAYPLIVSAQSNIDFRDLAGIGDYRIVATYNLLYNASLLVRTGVGIALCLDGIIPTYYDHSQLAFVPLTGGAQDSLQVIWKNQGNQSPVAKAFMKILEELAKQVSLS